MGKQSVSVQTISNPQVAGSNPAGRARKSKPPYGGFYFMYDAPGFEPAKKAVRTAAKRRTVVRRFASANFARWRSNPAGRARKSKPPYGGFYFMKSFLGRGTIFFVILGI